MSVFVARNCACGGKLEYNPNKKVWICMYCGTVVEREATFDKVSVDGIEGINDVVRQTLIDIANNRMESAARNLADCERKNHKHIGTLISNISYNLANISCAKSEDEARGCIDKVKIYGARLKQEFPVIAEDEINLYESFGQDEGDIFANLLVVFDTLGENGRVDFIVSKLQPEKVFSPHANKTLLKVAVRRSDDDMVDKIIGNIGHIDRKSSLQEVMEHYPSGERKAELIKKLFNKETVTALGKKFFENYFSSVRDDARVKAEVVGLLNTTDIHVNAELVVKSARDTLESYDEAKCLFDAIYDIKISDQETEALIVFCLMENKLYDIQNAFFDALIEKEVFVSLNARAVISFMETSEFNKDQKAEILRKMMSFEMDNRARDAIYNYYLNTNTDDEETREMILDVLLIEGAPVSTGTVENYLIKTQTDGEKKLQVLQKIFDTGINKTYVGDALSEYMLNSADPPEIQSRITEYLIDNGFRIDSGMVIKYLESTHDEAEVQAAKIKRLVQNGTQIKADTIQTYIMSLNRPEDFSVELFNLLTQHSCTLNIEAYARFLLFCKDPDKGRHNDVLINAVSGNLSDNNVKLTHNGNRLSCNVFQAYVLNTVDSIELAKSIVSSFNDRKVRLNTDIIVGSGMTKFKKYVGENKASLSVVSRQLCDENRMFSLF